MNTQETPVHKRLWNRDFALLVIANMLITTSIYMMIVVVAEWLGETAWTPMQKGIVMGAYGVGLFLLGPFCSYFVQRYRRNHVCELSIVLLAACVWCLGLMQEIVQVDKVAVGSFVMLRVVIGAVFGLAQMVLSSTLVIDVCESYQRTHANHAAAWFGRLSLAVGPLAVILLQQYLPMSHIYWVMTGLCLVAAVLIQVVKIPFRAPSDDYHSFSLDRFLMPSTWPLFLLLMAFTTVVGMMLVWRHDILYYLLMLSGFLVARLLQCFLQNEAYIRPVTALVMVMMSGAVFPAFTENITLLYVTAVLFGFGTGVVGDILLTCFLNMSHHCQRGTSQSSYFLAWELGISLGLFLAFLLPAHTHGEGFPCTGVNAFLAYILLIVFTLIWLFIGYPWYKRHKIR